MGKNLQNILALFFILIVSIYIIFEVYTLLSNSAITVEERIPIIISAAFIGIFLGNFKSLIAGFSISIFQWVFTSILLVLGMIGLVVFL
ncbi:MAG: hypothetical protein JXR64_12280 [Spirochaetales bacterium]|nr:hypothetical protein [Spirochaetales bacterium]